MDQGDVAVAVPPAAPSPSCAGADCKKGKRLEIKKWNAVALWAWGKRRRELPRRLPSLSLARPLPFS
jgi:hypothetical protein